MTSATTTLASLSNDIADTIDRVAGSIVAVEARHRVGSTGFYVRPHLVLTADHTLESDDIEIVSAGGATEAATIVGRDSSTDLALVRTASAGTVLTFAPADAARVGAIAIAVARDDDGDIAATMGVISAVGGAWRTWHGGEIDRFLPPDLALYPRFSGSPLIDANGAAIGMNTGGLSRRESITVPAATIERVITALLERGHIARGYLGVALQQVHLPEAFGGGYGAVVIGVDPDGPADRAGMMLGDVITGAEGTPSDLEDLHATIASAPIGAPLAVDVIRGGVKKRVDVIVGERSEREAA
jgi:S1-C subfamily serine protease